MAELINLRSRRKTAEREAARKLADQNAARHGRTKAERDQEAARAAKAKHDLDQHRREPE